MSRVDRFKLKEQLVERLRAPDWSFEKIELLFHEFDISGWNDDKFGATLAQVVATVPDTALTELYALVMQVEVDEVESVVESAPGGGAWQLGHVRLFLSHSALHKDVAAGISEQLAVVGIDAFVAHDAMKFTKPWQNQIEQALRSAQTFVALVHPEFNESTWCQQEVGWALGRRIPHFAVRIGKDPAGFLGSDQWPSGVGRNPTQVAALISAWVSHLPELGPTVLEGLFTALRKASNYVDAGAAAKRIAALGSLTAENFEELDEIWWTNNQLYEGGLAIKAMQPFYAENDRSWPPPRRNLVV